MKRRLSNQRTGGLTLVEVLMAIAAVVLLAAVLLPSFAKAKTRHSRISCLSNLKQIGLAFRMFSGDHGEKFPWSVPTAEGGSMEYVSTDAIFQHYCAISNELSSPRILVCSSDGARRRVASWDQPMNNGCLSYFAGLDAHENRPLSILSGDRNLTTNGRPAAGLVRFSKDAAVGWTGSIHTNAGNLAFGDGSAQQYPTTGVQTPFRRACTNVEADSIRLAIP